MNNKKVRISKHLEPDQIQLITSFKMKSQAKPEQSHKRYYRVISDYFGNYDFKGKKILELGPGQCILMRLLKECGASCYSLDLDENVTELCKSFGMDGETLNYSLPQALDGSRILSENKFDGITCIGSINLTSIQLKNFISKTNGFLKDDAFIWMAPWVNETPNIKVLNDNIKLMRSIGWSVEELKDHKRYTPAYETEHRYLILKNVEKKNKGFFSWLGA